MSFFGKAFDIVSSIAKVVDSTKTGQGGERERYDRNEQIARKTYEKVVSAVSKDEGEKLVQHHLQKDKEKQIASDTWNKLLGISNREIKEPAFGSVVFCGLGYNLVEHSGIYIGNNEIVELTGKGEIRKVGFKEFTDHITTLERLIWIPVSVHRSYAIGMTAGGLRAQEMTGNQRNYRIFTDNCHQFSSGCLTGNFENADNALFMLKMTYEASVSEKVKWEKWHWTKHM